MRERSNQPEDPRIARLRELQSGDPGIRANRPLLRQACAGTSARLNRRPMRIGDHSLQLETAHPLV